MPGAFSKAGKACTKVVYLCARRKGGLWLFADDRCVHRCRNIIVAVVGGAGNGIMSPLGQHSVPRETLVDPSAAQSNCVLSRPLAILGRTVLAKSAKVC